VGVQVVGRGQSWDEWPPNDQRDIPDHMMSCSAKKAGERREGNSESWHLSSEVSVTPDGALLSWEWLNICLLIASSELNPCLACLCVQLFLYLLNRLYINPQVFSLFPI